MLRLQRCLDLMRPLFVRRSSATIRLSVASYRPMAILSLRKQTVYYPPRAMLSLADSDACSRWKADRQLSGEHRRIADLCPAAALTPASDAIERWLNRGTAASNCARTASVERFCNDD